MSIEKKPIHNEEITSLHRHAALENAVYSNELEVVKLLMEVYNTDLYLSLQQSSIHLAKKLGYLDIYNYLVEATGLSAFLKQKTFKVRFTAEQLKELHWHKEKETVSNFVYRIMPLLASVGAPESLLGLWKLEQIDGLEKMFEPENVEMLVALLRPGLNDQFKDISYVRELYEYLHGVTESKFLSMQYKWKDNCLSYCQNNFLEIRQIILERLYHTYQPLIEGKAFSEHLSSVEILAWMLLYDQQVNLASFKDAQLNQLNERQMRALREGFYNSNTPFLTWLNIIGQENNYYPLKNLSDSEWENFFEFLKEQGIDTLQIDDNFFYFFLIHGRSDTIGAPKSDEMAFDKSITFYEALERSHIKHIHIGEKVIEKEQITACNLHFYRNYEIFSSAQWLGPHPIFMRTRQTLFLPVNELKDSPKEQDVLAYMKTPKCKLYGQELWYKKHLNPSFEEEIRFQLKNKNNSNINLDFIQTSTSVNPSTDSLIKENLKKNSINIQKKNTQMHQSMGIGLFNANNQERLNQQLHEICDCSGDQIDLEQLENVLREGANPNSLHKWSTMTRRTGEHASTFPVLHKIAVKDNAQAAAEILFRYGADLAQVDPHTGNTVLLSAIVFSKSHESYVLYLIRKMKEISWDDLLNQKDHFWKNSPLFFVFKRGDRNIVKALIEADANMSDPDLTGSTPLHWAALWRWDDIIKILVDKGANIHTKNNSERTVLEFYQYDMGPLDTSQYLFMIKVHENSFARVTREGTLIPELSDCCFHGFHRKEDSAVYQETSRLLETPLTKTFPTLREQYIKHFKKQDAIARSASFVQDFMALYEGSLLPILMSESKRFYGLNVNLPPYASVSSKRVRNQTFEQVLASIEKAINNFSQYPGTFYNEQRQRKEFLERTSKFLKDFEAFLTFPKQFNKTVDSELSDLFGNILSTAKDTQQFDLNYRGGLGFTLLQYVVANNEEGAIKFLLEQGANPNIQVRENFSCFEAGDTALHCYIKNNKPPYSEEIISLLLEKGADINLPNKDGVSVLDLVKENDQLRSLIQSSVNNNVI